MVHYFMKHSTTISEPVRMPRQSFGQFIFGMFSAACLGTLSAVVGALPGMPIVQRIVLFGTSLIFFVVIVYAILRRKNFGKNLITFDATGITFKNDTALQIISWQEIEQISLTYAFYAIEPQSHEAYPLMLFLMKDPSSPPQRLSVQVENQPLVHFVAAPEDFKDFLGNSENYTFAINIQHFPDINIIDFLAQFGKTANTTAKPIIQVKTNSEYNELLKKTYTPEKSAEYLLPEDTSN